MTNQPAPSISDNVCNRPWTFERVPNKMLQGLDNALIFTSTKEACLAACLNEVSSAKPGPCGARTERPSSAARPDEFGLSGGFSVVGTHLGPDGSITVIFIGKSIVSVPIQFIWLTRFFR